VTTKSQVTSEAEAVTTAVAVAAAASAEDKPASAGEPAAKKPSKGASSISKAPTMSTQVKANTNMSDMKGKAGTKNEPTERTRNGSAAAKGRK
jgi:hypothetical protein